MFYHFHKTNKELNMKNIHRQSFLKEMKAHPDKYIDKKKIIQVKHDKQFLNIMDFLIIY